MDNKHDFTQGSIFGKLIQFMIPILGALVLQAMYGAVDMMIVGHFGTTNGIAAVSTGSGVLNLVTFGVNAIATGVTILSGRYLGEGSHDRVGKLIGSAIAFFTLLSVILSVLLVVFAPRLAVLMQSPPEAMELTIEYIRICGGGFLFVAAYNLISCIFRGLGDSRMPLLFVSIACVVNIVGDLLLIAVFDMNVAGAAIATVGAQAVSVILSLLIIHKRKLPFRFSAGDIRFSSETVRFVKLGAPLALQEILVSFSFLAVCAFINRLGLDAANGYGIAQKIQSFVTLLPAAIMQSMASFVAQNVGARKEDRAKKGMLYGIAVGVGVGVIIAALAFFKGDLLASIFSNDLPAIGRAAEFLKGFAVDAFMASIMFSMLGYFNGHGKSLFVMAQGIVQALCIRLPVSYLMSIRPGATLTAVGLATPASTLFGIMVCLIYYRRVQREIREGKYRFGDG